MARREPRDEPRSLAGVVEEAHRTTDGRLRGGSDRGPGVGWVDSKGKRLDDDRTMLYLTRRRPTSGWSRPNKQRVERLLAEGRMGPAGQAAIDAAKENGTWSLLDDVENLVVPDDLAAEFDRHPGAREAWDGFPRSVKRSILEWIVTAKRPETRRARIAETAEKAGRGERAHQ